MNVREKAVRALGQIRDPRAVDPLIATLKNDRHFVRRSAASALGEIKDSRAVEPLIAALQIDDQGMGVRSSAAWALGKIKDLRAIEPLIALLKDKRYHGQREAVTALKSITGARIGDDPEKWTGWWKRNREEVLRGKS
jgi:HEAT repeat protein